MILPTDPKKLAELYGDSISTKPIFFNGQPQTMPVFKIPIDVLYFNDQNARITTFTQDYNLENTNEPLNELRKNDIKKYNDLFAEYVKRSSNDKAASFYKTKDDIKSKGQENPGVILPDGRVIDGNRRFAAIRELAADGGLSTFNCVVLPIQVDEDGNYGKNYKEMVKQLELNLQFSKDAERPYDPIDRLAGFYRDTVDPETAILTKREYMNSSRMSEGDYNHYKEVSELMVDYLKWREIPGKYSVLKAEKLDPALEDIYSQGITKLPPEEKRRVLDVLYPTLTFYKTDSKKTIRPIAQSYKKGTPLFDRLERDISLNSEANDKIFAAIKEYDNPPNEESTEESQKRTARIAEAKSYIVRCVQDAQAENARLQSQEDPLAKIEKALKSIKSIAPSTVSSLNKETKELIKANIKELMDALKKLEDVD